MSATLLAGLLGLAAPVGPTDEGVLYEPPADQVDETEPPATPEPPPPEPVEAVAPEPPPPEPVEPEPTTPELEPPPPFSPPKLSLPPPPPPPTGAGRLVGGSFAIGLGLAAASVVIVESTREGGNPQFVASTFIPLGLTGIGVGTYLLVRGAKARSNFNDWRAYTQREALPSGDGLIVAGTMSTLIGGVTLVAAAVQARDPDALDRPLTPTLFAVGATGVAVGVGALTWGLLRRGKYLSWRQSTFLSGRGRVTPVVAPLLGPDPSGALALRGASFAVVGRL